ncbi:expressed unknown protein [Seminavis robusta]|uniref:Fe2OG dioxygenase domain-containing protein n=1 Tax=Seminavis robusta TaxID=568900 RepID=A0A9N8HJK9_9STRA|nr:expressed unknown protein [Seminavis robusta]|eukprot:Sro557_g166220.1 n/a (666) ;mRNA; f:54077-56074
MATNNSNNNNNDKPIIRHRQVVSRRRRDGLIRYASDTTSQNGEDGIIARIFDCLPPSSCRYCVDIGAWDGKHLSNTYSLLVTNGNTSSNTKWKGLLVEADPHKFQDLSALHTPRGNICIQAAISTTPKSPHRLEKLLHEHSPDFPLDFDFLCIDIDGSDYWVLDGLFRNSPFRPKLICIEFNPTMPQDLIYIPPRNDSIRHGASIAALVELAQEFHYVLVETTLFNAFFVPQTLFQQYLVDEVPDDRSIEALQQVTMGTSLYQLYDGTLKVWGCKKLLWHRMAMDETKLQMLPPAQRQFPFAPSSAADSTFQDAAVVDMSAILGPTQQQTTTYQQQQCADELLQRLAADGFALVRGTGLSRHVCHEALQITKAFLTDADETVRRSCLTKDRARRGYSPMCTENFASLIGTHGPNDLVRKFRMGPPTTTQDITNNNNGTNSNSLLQPNIWPTDETWDAQLAAAFQTTMEDYYQSACEVANAIVAAIADAMQRQHPELSLDVLLLPDKHNSAAHTSILTLLGYTVGTRHKPGKKNSSKSPLVASHTDVGVITMLLFDGPGCAKLQRSDGSGGWVDVQLPSVVPEDPILVINIGDCLSELTHHVLPSTLHRVVADTKCKDPRHCLALFMGLDPAASLTIQGETIFYEDWRKRRIARSQQVLKEASNKE